MTHPERGGFDNPDFGLALGLAWGLAAMNAQNQANAEYNAIRQGYMSQGYTAEQATELTDLYFQPIWTRNAMVFAHRRRVGWAWATTIWGLVTAMAVVHPAAGVTVAGLVGGTCWPFSWPAPCTRFSATTHCSRRSWPPASPHSRTPPGPPRARAGCHEGLLAGGRRRR